MQNGVNTDLMIKKRTRAVLITAGICMMAFSACGGEPASSSSVSAEETLAVATESDVSVAALTPAGPQFPSLDVTVPTTEPAPEIIRKGTRSWIVAELQQRLMDLGFMDNDEPTDYYGDYTEDAVKIYQRQNNLSQDGIVGQDTLKAIMSDGANYYAAQKGESGTDIAKLQQRLYEMGYLAQKGEITGNFDDATLTAVQKFQLMNALDQDGKVGRKTMNLLYSENVKANMLAYGEKSEVVLTAQKRLFELGYLTSEPDGTFGLGTVMAIKEFQSRNNQVVDGYLGPGTREALNNPNAQAFGLVLGNQSDTVTKVQQLLNKWGYLESGSVTGYYGDATQQAVKDFQKRNSLSVDGSVGAATMEKLTGDKVVKPAPKTASSTKATKAPSGGGTSTGSGGGKVKDTPTYSGGGSVGTLLSAASSKLGSPYVWGAKGPSSFDCSGFVYWCLNQAGVNQSYQTSGGWASSGRGQRISSFSDLQAGDIIVENGHVGICAGGGTVYDASSSNGQVVHRSLSGWWENNFIVGWRIF